MTRTKNIFSFGATGTSIEQVLHECGRATTLVIDVPNFTNNVTVTIDVKDVDNYTLWTSETFIKNDTYLRTGLDIALDYNYKIVATLSGDAGGSGGDVKAMFYVEPSVRR